MPPKLSDRLPFDDVNLYFRKKVNFEVNNFSDNCLKWLDEQRIKNIISQPCQKNTSKNHKVVEQGILNLLIIIAKSLKIKIKISESACKYGGGSYSFHNGEKMLAIAPIDNWNNTTGIINILPDMTAVQHMNSVFAHEIGHATGNDAVSRLHAKRARLINFTIITIICIILYFLYLYFSSYITIGFGTVVGLSVCTTIILLYIYYDSKIQAEEEVTAEIIGYCIIRSIYEASDVLKLAKWQSFEYSRIHLLNKITAIPKQRRYRFIRNLMPEIERRINVINNGIQDYREIRQSKRKYKI